MFTKKDIPFDLLKVIEPQAQANLDLIQKKSEENTYYSFVETDVNSNNFFKIYIDGSKKFNGYDRTRYIFERKPANSNTAKPVVSQVNIKELERQFQDWLKLIRSIDNTPSVHDDNFLKKYAEYYYNEFKIIDADADIAPFDPAQQELFEAYLHSLSNSIEKSDVELSENVKNELLLNLNEVESSLLTSTKNQVMKKLSIVFGELYKTSKSFTRQIMKEARTQLIKRLVDLGIMYGPKLLEML